MKKREYFLQIYTRTGLIGYIVTEKNENSHYYQQLNIKERWGICHGSIKDTANVQKLEPISEKWLILRGYSLLKENA